MTIALVNAPAAFTSAICFNIQQSICNVKTYPVQFVGDFLDHNTIWAVDLKRKRHTLDQHVPLTENRGGVELCDPADEALEVLSLGEGQQHRMIGGLHQALQDLHIALSVYCRTKDDFLEQVDRYQARAAKRGQ